MTQEMTFMNKVIAFEGNIGAGKSTICGKLKQIEPARCSVYKEQGNEKFLKLFYSDPGKYGFAYQWGMLKTRRYQLMLAQQDMKFGRVPPKQYYFWDRSMVGDYIFALWNHLLGGISQQEMEVYEDEFGGSIKRLSEIKFLSDVSCYIYLNDEPRNCKHRVESCRRNESESAIPLDYYEGIDDIHFDLFVRRVIPSHVSKVVVLTWGQYHSETDLWKKLEEVIVDKDSGAKITFHEEVFDEDNVEHGARVYKSAEDVLTSYSLFPQSHEPDYSNPELLALGAEKHVYIPEQIMQITEREKKVVENDFDVKFYRNEYKRVVLFHLSQGQHVHFYQFRAEPEGLCLNGR